MSAAMFASEKPVSTAMTPAPTDAGHSRLFTSGAYVKEFRPDDRQNPFMADYARKRAWVLGSVAGRGTRVLDMGGGMGRMAVPLARNHRVVLCDLSRSMLEIATEAGGIDVAVADVRSIPFANGSFDTVLCIDVLPHLPDPSVGLAEIRRVLRPGGRAIIDSTNSNPAWTLAYPRYLGRRPRRWVGIWQSGGVLPEWHGRVRHLTRDQFRRALSAAGLEIVKEADFGPRFCPKWHAAVVAA